MTARWSSAVVVVLWLIFAAPALAGTYTVHACTLPDGSPAPIDGWTFASGAVFGGLSSVTCDAPDGEMTGWLYVSARAQDPAPTAQSYANWTFTAPPETVIDSYTIYRHEYTQAPALWFDPPLYTAVQWFNSASGGLPVGGCSPLEGCLERGNTAATARFSSENRAEGSGDSAQWLTVSARCFHNLNGPGTQVCPGTARFSIYSARIRLRDLAVPRLTTEPSGGLVDPSEPVSGVRAVRIAAEDRGGGLARAVLLAAFSFASSTWAATKL